LNQQQYSADVRQLTGALAIAHSMSAHLDLEAMARSLERADSIGVMLDPTAWRRANDTGQLEALRELVHWAKATRAAHAKIRTFAERLVGESLPAAAEESRP
jgi:hypothetical protein